jgi:SAM-dependent methyltransferase
MDPNVRHYFLVNEHDVPSPIDWCDPEEAREWERTAPERSGRGRIFWAFRRELLKWCRENAAILELGSGPGFLADYLLDRLPDLRLTLLDLYGSMHSLAQARLGERVRHVVFVERDFKVPGWSRGLGPFDAVITNQAVHELRHKRHAATLHAAVQRVLRPGGIYLVSDHFYGVGGLQNSALYMTAAEQRDALLSAGYTRVQKVAEAGSLVMHRATGNR